MREIKEIIIHCSDSDIPEHDNLATIRGWHVQRGFKREGYHYFIRKDGLLEIGRPLIAIGAHTLFHNKNSVGICLSGKHNFNDIQFDVCSKVCLNLIVVLRLGNDIIVPHCQLDSHKTCPNFDVTIIKRKIDKLIQGEY